MINLLPMTARGFEEFKKLSQLEYATAMLKVEDVSIEEALKYASEQNEEN